MFSDKCKYYYYFVNVINTRVYVLKLAYETSFLKYMFQKKRAFAYKITTNINWSVEKSKTSL